MLAGFSILASDHYQQRLESEVTETMTLSKPQVYERPSVSVLMPAYNHEKYVADAIRSVWSQTYKHVELIVIDDGSTDRTKTVIESLCPQSPIHMVFVARANCGVAATLNECVNEARGTWITFLASDDYYAPRFIERYIETSRQHPECRFFHCDALEVDETGRIGQRLSEIRGAKGLSGQCFYKILEGQANIIASTVMVQQAIFNEVGLFDEALHQEDLDFHLRAARVTPFCYIDEPLFFSRKVKGSLGRNPSKWIADGEKAISKHEDFLGDRFKYYMHLKYRRNIDICLGGNYYSGFFRYTALSIKTSNSMSAFVSVIAQASGRFAYSILRFLILRFSSLSPFLLNRIKQKKRGIESRFRRHRD